MWITQHCKLLDMTSAVRRTRQNVPDGAIANIPIEKHSIIIQLWCEAVMNQLIPIIISARKINRETAPNKSSAVSIFAIDEAATTMMSWARFFCCLLFWWVHRVSSWSFFYCNISPISLLVEVSKEFRKLFSWFWHRAIWWWFNKKKNRTIEGRGFMTVGFVYMTMNLVRIHNFLLGWE